MKNRKAFLRALFDAAWALPAMIKQPRVLRDLTGRLWRAAWARLSKVDRKDLIEALGLTCIALSGYLLLSSDSFNVTSALCLLMIILVALLFGSQAENRRLRNYRETGGARTSKQGFEYIWSLLNDLKDPIDSWQATLPRTKAGQVEYSAITEADIREVRDWRYTIWSLVNQAYWPAYNQDQIICIRKYLLSLPWPVFPSLSNELIAALGISEEQRAERLAITQEEPAAFSEEGYFTALADGYTE